MIKISPSVLACDLSRLAKEVEEIHSAGADMIHLDVMDGVFVTNISFGLPVIKCLRKNSKAFFDVHLMITEPEKYIERFITECGADLISFHLEATNVPDKCIEIIKKHGKKAAITVKPNTPIETVYPYLDKCDMVLVMTVEPGYGGQALIPECLDKVKELKEEIERRNLSVDIEVDGGINTENAKDAIKAGANILVAGSAVFGAADPANEIEKLRNLAAKA